MGSPPLRFASRFGHVIEVYLDRVSPGDEAALRCGRCDPEGDCVAVVVDGLRVCVAEHFPGSEGPARPLAS